MGTYVEVEKNVSLYVEDVGTGTPVIFLHGWPLNSRMFEYQFTWLSEQGYRCIGIDQRGFGKSDAPAEGYSYDRLADDIKAVIDRLELDQVYLVGFSVGGAIAVRYMARHGGYRIRKLALLGAAAPAFTQRDQYPYGMKREDAQAQIAAIRQDRPQLLRDFGSQFLDGGGERAISEPFKDWLQQLGLEASAWGTVHTFESLRDEDLRDDIPQIKTATTIFQGMKDIICPPEFATLLLAGIDGSTLVQFEQSGHGMLFDEPDKFNEELLRFLK
ncbi:alpha/beta fold hydrolase [Paenibacillus radicis (ex Gao et al. 2016)]|uniref:AB hydrolase superfamily protein YisY n=1 Tax=Paenibacillus radicis (ex Gao et al. 2016) TaxID=1737354 RepID=A0A917HKB9_9BACL|nr:alpha/beta hydrolase [Paenibacillus radicis (ex Gao et al. 2016)]GGG81426.1 AB hydrolase superfamily protein YisY [Paenibacillus radicis (ex Gao et al. 2016)]